MLSCLRFLLLLFFAILLTISCQDEHREVVSNKIITTPQITRDLSLIRDSGVLKVITIYSSTSYFLYRGQTMGFEYELISHMAEELGLDIEIKIAHNINDLFNMLNRGEGDLIAYGLTITEPRKKIVSFTNHHYVTHQALVQRKPDNWRSLPAYKIDKYVISNVVDLIGDTVYVRRNSSYYHRLRNLAQEVGGPVYIEELPGELPTDEIIEMVVHGKLDYTVADYNIASINKTYYPILHIDTPVSLSQRIAWAVRKNSPDLLAIVNQWIKKIKKDDLYYILYHKYFKNQRSFKRRIESEFFSKNSGKISRYDPVVKKYASQIGWDWRLLSAMIYQESRFRTKVNSWAGARGLMQMMPATAEEMGVENILDPEENIRGGTKYLHKIWKQWEEIPDSVQRVKFSLASYNCGFYHVKDAQKLALKFGADPLIWDGHVAEYILKLADEKYYNQDIVNYGFVRGREPYEYVEQIFKRYNHYKKFIPLTFSS